MKTLNLDAGVIASGEKTVFQKTGISEEIRVKPFIPEMQTEKKVQAQPRRNGFQSIGSLPRKVLLAFQSLSNIKKIILTGFLCASVVTIGGMCIYQFIIKEKDNSSLKISSYIFATSPLLRSYQSKIPLPEPHEPRTIPSPINGELYTKKEYDKMKERFPIAVIIENQVQARPQSGYNSADIVFETLAEGGITRTMAIFWGKSASQIGPIRSARVYFIEWALPFDPLVMHIGYAISDDPRIDVTRMKYNGVYRSLDRGGTFWRSTERFAPHNAYSSSELLYEKAQLYGLTGAPKEIESWQFKQDAPLEDRGNNTGSKIVFFERLNNNGLYDITWKYDADRNGYTRYNNETPYTDTNTESEVYAKNVIIQRLSVISAYDEKAHMIVTTIGTGDAIILRDGQAIYGTWRKESATKRTRYYDADGTEITFNRGIIWVEAVPTDLGSVTLTP